MVPHADDEAPALRGAAADPQLGAAERQHEQQRGEDVDPEVGDHHDGEHVHLATPWLLLSLYNISVTRVYFISYDLAQSVLDPTAIYLGGVNQKRGNNRGENV